mmetsp:Transcript_17533/g.25945  ORF Transcript_17533/g.25945 Transcript_17533/m.25945 type:complete len:464 (-) Transcript_17533:132-1523(-)|eukprot:CAMPEP_0194220684 /NCGR_PEP_ID=MMETSP0156-20130528/28984_1 /TAXON_ID=33649 /ORGANISM="Thalassionema nitzschioides, Strain L26-B" /LENGTH=463 /DNA_ID=CAMNT_0038950815 /DNA_START=77 /DNA_END=1468 /DNA_ORIENTATION=+
MRLQYQYLFFSIIVVACCLNVVLLSTSETSGSYHAIDNQLYPEIPSGRNDRDNLLPDLTSGFHEMKNQKIPESNSIEASHLQRKFFLLEAAQFSTDLINNSTDNAIHFYDSCLNEEVIEIWLHKGFKALRSSRTYDITHADVVLIPFYGHFSDWRQGDIEKIVNSTLIPAIYNKNKPHVVLCPSNNPKRSRDAGIPTLITSLEMAGVNVWSVGIERNPGWQGNLNPRRIIPIPYLVKPASSTRISVLTELPPLPKRNSSFFYTGDLRPNAIRWSGCNRSMVEPLSSVPEWMVRIVESNNRLSQKDYNKYVETMEFCLIVCGDTPTSRSLASSIVHGCIPVFVGPRWQGKCEKPCKCKFGWAVTNIPHLPYMERIDWSQFPLVNEAEFARQPEAILRRDVLNKFHPSQRHDLREKMRKMLPGWVYGVGNPVTSDSVGGVAEYAWHSILHAIDEMHNSSANFTTA